MKRLLPMMIALTFALSGCEQALRKPLEDSSEVPVSSIQNAEPKEPFGEALEAPVEETENYTENDDDIEDIEDDDTSDMEDQDEQSKEEKNPSEDDNDDEPSESGTAEAPDTASLVPDFTEEQEDLYPIKSFGSPYNSDNSLSNKKMAWYFAKNKDHTPPGAQADFDIREFGGYYLGDTTKKELYLTFDEGYENGYTEKILDILKEKQVPAAFFVVEPYIKTQPELIQRMVDEGHIVGNHSVRHLSCPDLSDEEMKNELVKTNEAFKELTGQDMPPYFRPPMGEYSARTLKITNDAGYKSIFWSFAYRDWEVDKQPGRDAAYNAVMGGLHNGQIMLLHAVSSSNTEALGDIIDACRAEGYTFKPLYDLPNQ